MAKKRGRPRKAGPRKLDGTLERGRFTPPPDHIVRRREMFSFADGGDQDVCDGIGQLHALGLLDGQPIDGLELRNIGREWRNLHLKFVAPVACRTGSFERTGHSSAEKPLGMQRLNDRDRERYQRLGGALSGTCHAALHMLLIEPEVGSWPQGEEMAPWVRGIINEALLKRGKIVPFLAVTMQDRFWLEEAIRGLFLLYDASLPGRYERRAA